MPLFSFITCTYQSNRFVRRCYASLAAQTVTDWEWVVADDASSDGTADTIASLADSRIRYERMNRNAGRGIARRRALDRARGKYCAIIDMDDFCFPDRLERAYAAMEAGYHYYCSPVVLINARYEVTGVREIGRTGYPRAFIHASLCARTDLVRSISYAPYREAEDQQMILRIANELEGYYDAEPLYAYHEGASTNVTRAFVGKYYTIRSLLSLVQSGTLHPNGSVSRLLAFNIMKMVTLAPLLFWPAAYLRTLQYRSGKTAAGSSLSAERWEFVQLMADTFPMES